MSRSRSKNSSAVSSVARNREKPVPGSVVLPVQSPPQWVVVQLSSTGEREKDLPAIHRAAHRILGRKLEVFIPAVVQEFHNERETTFYMDGYIFIKYEPGVHYLKLQETTYFRTVLCSLKPTPAGRKYEFSLLKDSELDKMRAGMKSLSKATFSKGNRVKFTSGTYKGLDGVVSLVYEEGDKVQVETRLVSKPVLIDAPVSMLTRLPDDDA